MKNRTIKFRIWNKKEKKWEFGYETLGGCNLFGETHVMGYFNLVELNDYIPMQYTGLKDCHGQEIYEGDIVYCKGYEWSGENSSGKVSDTEPCKVEWNEKDAGFDPFLYRLSDFYSGEWDKDRVEIIGNVWENPELIK